jgi:putative heme-binding domain-containing protein
LGDEYAGNAFTCEPVNQLVHRQVLKRTGMTFAGERAEGEEQSEFLTSTDNWFRPVQARTGPDGALYLVDMYRYVIEHGQWIPDETKAELDIFAGQRLGRIYRVVPQGKMVPPAPDFTRASTEDLLVELRAANGVRRDLAAQVLLWRGENSVEVSAAVRKIADDPVASAAVRVQALATACLLSGGLRTDDEIASAIALLKLSNAEAVRATLRLIDRFADGSRLPDALAEEVVRLAQASEVSAKVEALGLLGRVEHLLAAEVLVECLGEAAVDSPERYAAMASLNRQNAAAVWKQSLANWRSDSSTSERLELLLSASLDLGDRELEEQLFQTLAVRLQQCVVGATPVEMAAAARWCRLAGRWLSEISLREDLGEEQKARCSDLLRLAFASLPELAANGTEASEEAWRDQLEFIRLVRTTPLAGLLNAAEEQRVREATQAGLDPSRSPTVQLAAMRLLAAEQVGLQIAWERWNSLTPELRRELLETVLSRKEFYDELLTEFETGRLRPGELDAGQRGRLLAEDDPAVRARAVRVLQQETRSDRSAIVKEWEASLQLQGDFERGRVVFRQHCAACHQMDGTGYEVGPDLAALSNRAPSTLLLAILDPNRDVESRYVSYSALTTDGLTFTGMLAEETATSVRLKEREGKEKVILRSDLEQLQATRKSVMPEGLEQELQPGQVVDLLAYLGPSRSPRRVFEGNRPELVRSGAHAALVCEASTAEIYGESIIYEAGSPFRNLGYWSGDRDHAVWTMDVPAAGAYEVYLDFACNPDSAGNGFLVVGSTGELAGVVESTGGWSEYRWKKLGELRLSVGQQRLTIGFSGPRRSPALMDLRTVVLVPAGTTWPAK